MISMTSERNILTFALLSSVGLMLEKMVEQEKRVASDDKKAQNDTIGTFFSLMFLHTH